jgi:ectoine hydroxylase-related dioxygenase (phytanoyl-CoA dioxygenase family)
MALMLNFDNHKQEIFERGFTIIEHVFSYSDIDSIIRTIETVDTSGPTFRKMNDLFAIRQFLKEVPAAFPCIFTKPLNSIIDKLFGEDYFVVKSIYFDKPGESNWFVSYHQDLTISVNEKTDIQGFGPWSVKQNQYAVQPPLEILEDNFTIRIHLDDTNEDNGALRVIPGSHLKGICRPETIDWSKERESTCNVTKGGIMIMRPLLLHASSRTINNKRRRVIHLEFSKRILPKPLQWSERSGLQTAR